MGCMEEACSCHIVGLVIHTEACRIPVLHILAPRNQTPQTLHTKVLRSLVFQSLAIHSLDHNKQPPE